MTRRPRGELVHRILLLRERGLTLREIARALEVSRHFVRAVLQTRKAGWTGTEPEHVLPEKAS